MLRKKIIVFAVISLAVVACASPAIKTTALVPAKFHEAAKLKEVAVLPFDGPGGKEFAAEIEGVLANINIGDKQYFTLVDRTTLERVISEMKLSQSALVDPATAAKVGKLVGTKGIYTGAIITANTSDGHFTETRRECAEWEKIEGERKWYQAKDKCVKWKEYTVPCIKRDAIFSFTPKLIEVETGRIVYANTISGTASSSACQDRGAPLSSYDLIQQAKQPARAAFRNDVAPYYITIEIKLMDSTDDITSEKAEKEFEHGIDFAKNNRFDRACELWGEARTLSPDSTSILYNLGICSEITGEFEEAMDLYRKADRSLGKPDDRITAALGRVSEAIQKQKRLKEQLLK